MNLPSLILGHLLDLGEKGVYSAHTREVVYTRIDKLEQLPNYELLYNEGGIVLAKIKPD